MQEAPPPSARAEAAAQQLKDLSYTALGRGYDRALDMERADCFQRGPKTVTPINEWEAYGYLVTSDWELSTLISAAPKIGVKIQAVELSFGASTKEEIKRGSERGHYVMLARYTSHAEVAGQVTGYEPVCNNMPSNSANNVEDFVSLCGDSYLKEKIYGGHVLISWKRNSNSTSVDSAIGLNFGATAMGANVNVEVNLEKLVKANYGNEEVYLEVSGMPFLPTPVQLPSGNFGFTIESTLKYLQQVAQSANGSTPQFTRVVDYSLERQTIAEMDACLFATARTAGMKETEWDCVHERLKELVEVRDGTGSHSDLENDFLRHKLAVDEYLPRGRLIFNTVPQTQCAKDHDGDPDLEVSGPCQAEALQHFVEFYAACKEASEKQVQLCRGNVLGSVSLCDDFEMQCGVPMAMLPSGPVLCDEAGLTQAKNSVIPYTVSLPTVTPPPGGRFTAPLVVTFAETPRRAIPNVSASTHLCGITGVSGGLHDSTVLLEPSGSDWVIEVINGSRDADKAVNVEVTCVSLNNFVFLNGGTANPARSESVIVPALNGAAPFKAYLTNPGQPSLLGWVRYLSEPQTSLSVTNPQATGYGLYFGFDLFPFTSTNVRVGTSDIQANPSSSGIAGGQVVFPSGMPTVGLLHNNRSTALNAFPLVNDAFCYLTGLKGMFYNANDGVRISKSNGMTTLLATTPLSRDRNPGASAQCMLFDRL